MNLSYWEIKSWLTNIDFTIIGSGIVGLNTALQIKNHYPKAKVLILEKGVLPQGASTKNAGFACFGSLSEIVSDLEIHTEEEIFQLVKQRVEGLKLLRKTLGDKTIRYKEYGGYELFQNKIIYEKCQAFKTHINRLLHPIFNADVFTFKRDVFGFNNVLSNYGFNQFEGQLDTGMMMEGLVNKVQSKGIKILNSTTVKHLENLNGSAQVVTNHFSFKTINAIVTTNGFSSPLIKEKVIPARAQILITTPIKNLKIKGTFHLDRGFYYFRNINNWILLGGGRNLDLKGEQTTKLEQTLLIQDALKNMLITTILPNTVFEIEHQWSGIMGVGQQKKPIVKQLDTNIYCGVRLGGMGVAIGSMVGVKLAEMIKK